jgi:hypothetical protein
LEVCDKVLKQSESSVAMNTNGYPSYRPVLTHCQFLGDDIIKQMQNLNVVANIQPSFVPTDMHYISLTSQISDIQLQYSYAWKTLLRQYAVVVAGGSDAPVEDCSPLLGLYDAIYRCSRTETTLSNSDTQSTNKVFSTSSNKTVYRSEECLSLSEALWIYTRGGAIACNMDHLLGSIENGYIGDLVILDSEVLNDTKTLNTTQPLGTVIGGDMMNLNASKIVLEQQGLREFVEVKDMIAKDSIELKGPFIPGKNGKRSIFQCLCSLYGKKCQ